jgi:hypothetical protein
VCGVWGKQAGSWHASAHAGSACVWHVEQGAAAACTHLTPDATPTNQLQARPNSIAVFVPSEITTHCFYPGLQKDYMVSRADQLAGGGVKGHSLVADPSPLCLHVRCCWLLPPGCQCHLQDGWCSHPVQQPAPLLAHGQVSAAASLPAPAVMRRCSSA